MSPLNSIDLRFLSFLSKISTFVLTVHTLDRKYSKDREAIQPRAHGRRPLEGVASRPRPVDAWAFVDLILDKKDRELPVFLVRVCPHMSPLNGQASGFQYLELKVSLSLSFLSKMAVFVITRHKLDNKDRKDKEF